MGRPGVRSLVAVMVVVVLLAACGGGTNLVKTVSAAPGKTTAAKTAKFAATVKSESGPLAKGLTTEGGFDFTNRRGVIQLDPSTLGIPGLTAKIDAVLEFSNGFVEYLHFPQLAAKLQGKEWLKLDVGAFLKKQTGADIGAALQGQSSDPSAGLQQLRGATDVVKIGTDKVRGVDATHYRATVDLDKSVQAAPASVRADLQKLVDLYTVRTFPIDVWIDAEGRVVRQVLTIDPSTIKVSTTVPVTSIGKMTVTVEFFDFGAPVDAALPAPEQTADYNELLAGTSSSTPFSATGQPLN